MTTRTRAPTLEGLVKAKMITQLGYLFLLHYFIFPCRKELEMLHAGRISEEACKYWIPLQWIIVRIRVRKRIRYSMDRYYFEEMRATSKKDSLMSDYESVEFFQEIANLRGNLGDLLSFDWVPMPIAFMQVTVIYLYR